LLIKADLAIAIATIIKQQGLNQTAVAKVLGIDLPKVSRLSRGDLLGFSIEQLIRLLGAQGRKVSLSVETVGPIGKKSVRGKRATRAA
jgi:predicted XRE-type DNA-binding protein